jgi:hypothetical protein
MPYGRADEASAIRRFDTYILDGRALGPIRRAQPSNRGFKMRRFFSVAMAGMLLGVVGGTVVPAAAHAVTVGCAPGAFDDTEGVVAKIGATIKNEMKRIERAVDAANLSPGDTRIKVRTLMTGVLVKTTLARSADGNTYSYELDMAQPSATPTYVLVSTASRTHAGTVGDVRTVNKQIFFDYDARASVTPTRPTGHFDATIVHVTDASKPAPGDQVTLSVSFDGFTMRPSDPHGARSGSYLHVGQATIGGSLDFHASIPVPCPGNPAGPVEIRVQRRHADDASGERTYRRDALVTGGALAAGEQSIAFVCGTNTPSGTTIIRASYKLHKIENADGSTKSYTIKLRNETAPNCNPAFGPEVSPDNNSTDSPFAQPVTFPGEW